MFCNRCGTEASLGQEFCTDCGNALPIEPGTEPTQPIPSVDGAVGDRGEPEPPATVELPVVDDGSLDDDHHDHDQLDDDALPDAAWPDPPTPAPSDELTAATARRAPVTAPRLYDLALDEPDLLRDTPVLQPQLPDVSATDQLPAQPAHALSVDQRRSGGLAGFRLGVTSVFGLIAGMTALFGMFTRVVAIRTTARNPSFESGDWLVADLGTNLPAALIVALVALLVGVIGAGFRQRWAAGLAGGAGLAVAGWVALTIGLSERPIEAAVDAVGRPTTEAFTVTITRDVGYWVLLAAGVLGLLTFMVSLASAGADRRRGLNPWIASLGAVAAVIAAVGPLIPQGTAGIEDNWSPGSGGLGLPAWFVVGRLVQLGLLAYAGVVGFLLVRRFGLGLAIGGMTVPVWLSISTLTGLTDAPVGPGYANPGSMRGDLELHAVTLVGMIALVGFAVVAVIAAYDQAAREYR